MSSCLIDAEKEREMALDNMIKIALEEGNII